ncbi:MAG TPA: DsrE family protein [Vicinamibacteria bacterium]|nr:DsrE family protein [Vicinamibacteria bacterium]
MKTLLILNDAPYGSERTYNGLRLAGALARQGEELRLFLMGDAVASAKSGQKVPAGYYNTQNMVGAVVRHAGQVGACGTCIDARGISEAELLAGVHRSSLEELTQWTLEADKVLVF